MDKVLIHDDGPYSGLVHTTKARFIDARETTCGIKTHSISTLHTPRLAVTCPKCLQELADSELKAQMDILQDGMNKICAAARERGLGVGMKLTADQAGARVDFELKRGLYNIKW